jgi:hypothetical protein
VGGVANSSHLTGWAADIRADSSNRRYLVLKGLIEAGFTRIGIGQNFIHCDCDPSKTRIGIGQNFIHCDCDPSKAGNVTWLY